MRTTVLAAVAILTAAGLAALRWQPDLADVAGPCPWRAVTGVPCPTCGATRAADALAHGRWAGALAAHPLATGALLGLGPATVASHLLRRRAVGPRAARRLAWLGAALLVANWAYLIARGG